MPNLEVIFPIGSRLAEIAQSQRGFSKLSNMSIGLLETSVFLLWWAAYAMLKSVRCAVSFLRNHWGWFVYGHYPGFRR
jgi:uncharacterized protein YktB (UPF0637 family)